ncbi:TNT domain-containing protein [Nonomuraea sp. NPDC005692]|uniref:TNT domain-containing protein n=1 Tax=Nonomuraea sp. NPDC005692 TaxID=3157168 RepID=UPI00340A31EA
MRINRRSVVLAVAICLAADPMGSVSAHADSTLRQTAPLVRPVPVQPTPPAGKGEPGKEGQETGGLVCGPPYVTGDPDLGPTILPRTGYLGALLRDYVPLGGLTPQHFLSRYWDYAANNYRFPPDSGFGRSGNYPNGRLLLKTTFLQIGMRLDRFGGYGGAFLSPLGDQFIKRALPPRNLNTNPQDPQHLCNYHAFRVLKSFRVEVGPAAPAFEQSGGGTQYHVLSRYIPEAPQTSEEVPVSWLLANGYLEEIEPVVVTVVRTDGDTAARDTAASDTGTSDTGARDTFRDTAARDAINRGTYVTAGKPAPMIRPSRSGRP